MPRAQHLQLVRSRGSPDIAALADEKIMASDTDFDTSVSAFKRDRTEIRMTFDEETIQAVWEKGRATLERDATLWREDECGAWMNRNEYGNPEAEFGWRIVTVVAGMATTVEHLRPFHSANGFDIANGRPHCRVTADRVGLTPVQHADTPHNRAL